MTVHLTDRAKQALSEWISPAQTEIYLRLMLVMEGG
jgi:hypothetical protein